MKDKKWDKLIDSIFEGIGKKDVSIEKGYKSYGPLVYDPVPKYWVRYIGNKPWIFAEKLRDSIIKTQNNKVDLNFSKEQEWLLASDKEKGKREHNHYYQLNLRDRNWNPLRRKKFKAREVFIGDKSFEFDDFRRGRFRKEEYLNKDKVRKDIQEISPQQKMFYSRDELFYNSLDKILKEELKN